jgi:hypothetical protein
VAERRLIGSAIDRAAQAWGAPHLHAGTGIRKLSPAYFECRVGLKTRLVFKALAPDALHFHFMGSHDEIRRFIKSGV